MEISHAADFSRECVVHRAVEQMVRRVLRDFAPDLFFSPGTPVTLHDLLLCRKVRRPEVRAIKRNVHSSRRARLFAKSSEDVVFPVVRIGDYKL